MAASLSAGKTSAMTFVAGMPTRAGDVTGDAPLVAGEQPDINTASPQLAHGRRGLGPDAVTNEDLADQSALGRDVDRSRCALCRLSGREVRRIDAVVGHQPSVADDDLRPFDRCVDAVAGGRFETCCGCDDDAASTCLADDRRAQGVLAADLGRSGKTQHVIG